ncbi:MAG: O-antigen ligase family protein [Alphaproteobacteria bacterium]
MNGHGNSAPGSNRNGRVWSGAVVGLLAVFAAVVWPRLAFFPVGPLGKVNPFTLATLAALAMLGLSQLSRLAQRAPRARYQAIDIGLSIVFCGLIVLRYISDFGSQDVASSLYLTVRETAYIFSFYLIGWWLVRARSFHALADILVLATYCAVLMGLVEIAAGSTLLGMLPAFMTKTVDPVVLADLLATKLRDGHIRVQAGFDHPILFAQFLAATAPMLVHHARFGGGAWRRIVALLFLGLAVFLIYRTGARSGLVALGSGCAGYFMLLVCRQFSIPKLVVACLVVISAVALAAGFYDEILRFILGRTASEIASFNARQFMISKAEPWIALRPILGFGDGMALQKAGIEGFGRLISIDNYYLSTVLNFGFAGLAALIGFLGLAMLSGWSKIRAACDRREASLMAAVVCMIFVIALVQSIVSIPGNMVFVFLGAGALLGHGAQRGSAACARDSDPP